MAKNLDVLERLLTGLDKDNLTRQEFTDAFQKVVDLVLKIQKQQGEAIGKLEETYKMMIGRMQNDHSMTLADMKKQVDGLFVRERVDKMATEHAERIKTVDERMAKVRDGKDGYIPKKGKDYFDGVHGNRISPTEVRDKLESLSGKEALDINKLSGVEELKAELKDALGKVRLGGRGFGRAGGFGGPLVKIIITGTVNGTNAAFTLDKDYSYIMLFWNGQLQEETTHYTRAGQTITFTTGNIPTSGTLHGVGQS